jgi:hypothetical protein
MNECEKKFLTSNSYLNEFGKNMLYISLNTLLNLQHLGKNADGII